MGTFLRIRAGVTQRTLARFQVRRSTLEKSQIQWLTPFFRHPDEYADTDENQCDDEEYQSEEGYNVEVT
jgi:hypothetical protein